MISFPFKAYRFTIIDDPIKSCETHELPALQQRLLAVASQRFGTSPSYSYFADTHHFAGKVLVICTDRHSGADLSFCALSRLGDYQGRPVVHLGSVFSVAEGRGLMHLMYTVGLVYLSLRSGPWRTLYVTSLTHTPRIFGAVDQSFLDVYPGLDNTKQPGEWHRHLRDRLMATYVRPEWNLAGEVGVGDEFVVPGLRRQQDGSILFPDTGETVPRHRRDEYNERVLELITLERGDEVLQVGRIGLLVGLIRKLPYLAAAITG